MESKYPELTEKENRILNDGERYWLGACWGTFSKKDDSFHLGNCFVPRYQTDFANWEVK